MKTTVQNEKRLSDTKSNLREVFKKKRAALSREEIDGLSNSILRQFMKISLPDIRYVHTFIPSEKLIEPDALLIADYLRRTQGDVVTTVPLINRSDYSMESVVVTDAMQYSENGLGISEPMNAVAVSPEQLDLILVPLVCFDAAGNRVGHGKGYYDRYLKRCRADALKVGISLFEPIDKILDVGRNDVALDYCCSPEKLFFWR